EGACNASAAATRAEAEPQPPSMVALRPFLSAATTSGNPGARWISRVRSLSPRSAVLDADRLELLGMTHQQRMVARRRRVRSIHSQANGPPPHANPTSRTFSLL